MKFGGVDTATLGASGEKDPGVRGVGSQLDSVVKPSLDAADTMKYQDPADVTITVGRQAGAARDVVEVVRSKWRVEQRMWCSAMRQAWRWKNETRR